MRWLIWTVVCGCSFREGIAPSGDAARDVAPPPDIQIDGGFDPAQCPIDYTVQVASQPSSRYRIKLVTARFSTQHADCADDAAGLTHLVVFNDQTEAAEVGAAYGIVAGTGPNSVFYVGAVQQPTQATPAQNWFWLTGAPFTLQWQTGSPNDNDKIEDNHNNAGRSLTSGKLEDAVAAIPFNAVCECDGKPENGMIAGYVQ